MARVSRKRIVQVSVDAIQIDVHCVEEVGAHSHKRSGCGSNKKCECDGGVLHHGLAGLISDQNCQSCEQWLEFHSSTPCCGQAKLRNERGAPCPGCLKRC